MRIIAGRVGGINLKSIKSRDIRPTLDRFKESMFNIIVFYIEKTNVLDLFAGFGSLGIEALSRGAESADFVENNKKHLEIIKENLNKSGLFEQAQVYNQDVYNYLKKCKNKYDLIFMDPPYNKNLTDPAINLILENNLLNKGALIISEKSAKEELKEYTELSIIKSKEYGNSLLTIYKFN